MLNILSALVGPEGVSKAKRFRSIACLASTKTPTRNCDTRKVVSNLKIGPEGRANVQPALTNNASEVR